MVPAADKSIAGPWWSIIPTNGDWPRPDRSLLGQVAQLSGGRYDPTPEQVLAPDGRTAAGHVPLWPYFLLAAVGVLLVEAALQRRSASGFACRRAKPCPGDRLMHLPQSWRDDFYTRLQPVRRRLRTGRVLAAIERMRPSRWRSCWDSASCNWQLPNQRAG